MSDQFERDLREHLHREAQQTPELPRRLRGRIREAISPRSRFGPAPQLALAGGLVVIAAVVLLVRSGAILNDFQTAKGTPSPSASAPTITSPSPPPTASATAGSSLPPFTCQDQNGGTSGSAPMQLTAVRVAHQAGYDRIVFEFAAPAGTTPYLPTYTVTRQASTSFTKDPSGIQVNLQGSDGLRIVFHGASANGSYSESRDLKPGLPVVKEVEEIGDFEAVLSWAAGLSQPSCIRAFELANPTRLVIDVQTG